MIKIFFFLLPLFFLFSGIDLATAQSVAPGGLVSCNGYECNACDLVKMANVIILWLFGIIFLIFAALMMTAGFGLVTSGGNQSALEAAKSKFKNGIIGILIVMAAWLLVDTVMKGLVGGGSTGAPMGEIVGWGPWSEVKCELPVQTHPWSRNANDTTDPAIVTPPTTPTTPTTPTGSYTHAQAVAQLSAGLSVSSSGNCSDKTKKNCTSLDGVKPLTITRINELQTAVGVPLIITGGTEAGHASGQYSHENGYKIDLRVDPALNNYITDNFTKVPNSNSRWKDSRGNIYYRHGPPDHWDILITN